MTKVWLSAITMALLMVTVSQAQEENPDFRIRAEFRDSGGESVGNATVKVVSRFMQVYYGGVRRSDDYRFQLSLESLQFANKSIDVKVDDFFVGTHAINSSGYLDVTYRNDWKPDDAPDLRLPANFPDPIDVGNTVSVYDSLTSDLLLTSVFGEEFARGDSDHDLDVDDDDYDVWRSGYGNAGIGPAAGEYSGNGMVDAADYVLWRKNRTPAAAASIVSAQSIPEPTSLLMLVTGILAAFPRRRRTGTAVSQ